LKGDYFYSDLRGLKTKPIELQSVKSMIWFQDREYPVREFRILNDQGKCVAISKVMAGQGGAIFEEKAYQYCVSFDLHVNAL